MLILIFNRLWSSIIFNIIIEIELYLPVQVEPIQIFYTR